MKDLFILKQLYAQRRSWNHLCLTICFIYLFLNFDLLHEPNLDWRISWLFWIKRWVDYISFGGISLHRCFLIWYLSQYDLLYKKNNNSCRAGEWLEEILCVFKDSNGWWSSEILLSTPLNTYSELQNFWNLRCSSKNSKDVHSERSEKQIGAVFLHSVCMPAKGKVI